jgi:hypothetical protein
VAALTSIIAALEDLAQGFPVRERPSFAGPASPEDLASLSRALGLALPGEFQEFLLLHDSIVAMDVFNGIWVGGCKELARSATRGDYPRSLSISGVAHTVIPVATDGGGHPFLLALDGSTVWRGGGCAGNEAVVASSFLHFLERLLEDFRHHLAHDKLWPYLTR